jgi:hypothetical protein
MTMFYENKDLKMLLRRFSEMSKTMTRRKHEGDSAKTVNAPSRPETPTVSLTPPTDEEERHLRSIEQSSSNYDPAIVVGGPRTVHHRHYPKDGSLYREWQRMEFGKGFKCPVLTMVATTLAQERYKHLYQKQS